MNIFQGVRMAIFSILSNKLRSFLTMLGIIIGVTAVIALVSIGQGATSQVEEQVQSLGTDVLTIRVFGRGLNSALDYEQAVSLSEVEGVRQVAPVISRNASVKAGNETVDVEVVGTNALFTSVRDYQVETGRALLDIDVAYYQKIALLGSATADELFGSRNPVGESVRIEGVSYQVVGVLAEKGDSMMGSQDELVLIPASVASRQFASGVQTVYAQVEDVDKSEQTIQFLETELDRVFRQEENSYNISNPQEILDAMGSISQTLTLALGGIAGISLLVGGIGIMNIMLVSVTERTREIGIRKAIGAKRKDVLTQFLIESIVLSGAGGLLGVALGIGGTVAVGNMTPLTVEIGWEVILISFAFSVAIGILFGWIPANKASRLNPIDALRFEV